MIILSCKVKCVNPALADTPGTHTEGATMKEDAFLLLGVADEALKGGRFRVSLDNGHQVVGHLSGKMRKNRIRITPGDRIQVEVSVYDLSKGRITFRYR